MQNKLITVTLYVLPIVGMIALIPFITNDYALSAAYAVCICALLSINPQKNDMLALGFGIVGITISELLFVASGVETFARHTLFGLIPLWLPLLWGYAFVTIKRSLRILDK